MFNKWLESNKVSDFDLSAPLYPTADDRGFWDGRCADLYVKAAEERLGYEWPMIRATDYMEYTRSGNRRRQENPHFARRTVLCALVLGEIAEYRGRFIPDIVDGIFAICEESFWGVSAHSICRNIPDGDRSVGHIDLFAAETGTLLAVTCYMLREAIEAYCPELISRVEWELRRRILTPYIDRTDFFWMGYGYPVNNWNSWIISNVITVYLLQEKDPAVLSRAVEKMMVEINRLYSAYPDDGGCDEGACYWAVSGGALFEFCHQLYVASGGKIDFFGDEKLRRIGRFVCRMYIGDGYFVNFADGTPKMTHSVTGLLLMMAHRTGEKEYLALAGEMYRHDPERDGTTPPAERDAKLRRRLYEMAYSGDIAEAGDFVPSDADILERLQVATVRAGDWFVAAKGGHNGENHNHNDVGSFIAYCNSEPVLVDPSCGTYVGISFSDGGRYGIWTNRSEWHNLPDVNGIQQDVGREYRADGFSLDGKTVSVSFADAYAAEAGAESVLRRITAEADAVTVADSFTLTEEGHITENFITPLPVEIRGGKAVIDGRFVLECDTAAEITADTADFKGDDRLVLYWKADEMKRIRFTFEVRGTLDAEFTLRRI